MQLTGKNSIFSKLLQAGKDPFSFRAKVLNNRARELKAEIRKLEKTAKRIKSNIDPITTIAQTITVMAGLQAASNFEQMPEKLESEPGVAFRIPNRPDAAPVMLESAKHVIATDVLLL